MNGPFSGSRLGSLREKRSSQNENPFLQSIAFLTQSNNKNLWPCSYNKKARISPQWTSWLEELPPDSSRAESKGPLDRKNLTFQNQSLKELLTKKITITKEKPLSGSVIRKKAIWNLSSMIRPNSIRRNPKSKLPLNNLFKSVFSSKKSNKKSKHKSNLKLNHKSSKRSSLLLTTTRLQSIKYKNSQLLPKMDHNKK